MYKIFYFFFSPSKWQLKIKYDSMATYTRFAPWLIGIGVGYLLHYCRQKEGVELSMKPVSPKKIYKVMKDNDQKKSVRFLVM